MSSNLPLWGKGLENAEGPEILERGSDASSAAEETQAAGRIVQSRSQERKLQAISDAQQGLSSLLDHHNSSTQPHIISPTGAIRNQTHGRIAGPTADPTPAEHHSPGKRLLNGPSSTRDGSSLSVVVPNLFPTSDFEDRTELRPGSQLGQVGQHLQAARDRASLLVTPPSASNGLGLSGGTQAEQVSRRAASQWVTRYATHLVIFLVVGTLVTLGGLRTLTAQIAYPDGLRALDASYTGTDHIEDDQSAGGKIDADSQDFQITLPRTELSDGSTALGAKATAGQQTERGNNPDSLTQYTVVKGDSVESIAAKYNLMPETVMGSNGIYDVEENLQAGRVLHIPPIDGMYYMAADGDTVETIANRFQVEPDVILKYQANNLSSGVIKPGQEIVVPGGMMPPRETTLTYTVRKGDTLKGIAARFGVDVPTMLYSNDISNPDSLQVGSQLKVLPVQGIEYKVKKGDSVMSVADRFGVAPQTILDYSPNHVQANGTLQVDQVLLVPGGRPPQEETVAERPQQSAQGSTRAVARAAAAPAPQSASSSKSVKSTTEKPVSQAQRQPQAGPAPTAEPAKPQPKAQAKPQPKAQPPVAQTDANYQGGSGALMWPVRGVITQYFSGHHNGLDIAAPAGTPIHAADNGRVIWAGWRNDGLGYCVMIDHLNGIITVYGHMLRQPYVYVGQYVSRGQVIGPLGSTGHSTGPHTHFMVKQGGYYRNPLAYLGR